MNPVEFLPFSTVCLIFSYDSPMLIRPLLQHTYQRIARSNIKFARIKAKKHTREKNEVEKNILVLFIYSSAKNEVESPRTSGKQSTCDSVNRKSSSCCACTYQYRTTTYQSFCCRRSRESCRRRSTVWKCATTSSSHVETRPETLRQMNIMRRIY
jgi:hypothetical protein